MGCSTLAHEQSHLNTFLRLISWELCMAFHFSTQLEEGAQWVHKKVNFSHYCTQKIHYPGVGEEKKNPNTFFLICAVIGYTMNTNWIIC
jgi:hypothetical protein